MSQELSAAYVLQEAALGNTYLQQLVADIEDIVKSHGRERIVTWFREFAEGTHPVDDTLRLPLRNAMNAYGHDVVIGLVMHFEEKLNAARSTTPATSASAPPQNALASPEDLGKKGKSKKNLIRRCPVLGCGLAKAYLKSHLQKHHKMGKEEAEYSYNKAHCECPRCYKAFPKCYEAWEHYLGCGSA